MMQALLKTGWFEAGVVNNGFLKYGVGKLINYGFFIIKKRNIISTNDQGIC